MENVTLVITYHTARMNGKMVINLNEFLKCRSIQKVKKLLKIIRESDQPELTESIMNYCSDYIEQIEPIMNDHANKFIAYNDKIPYAEEKLQKELSDRNRWKRNSQQWKALSPRVTQAKTDLSYLKMKAKEQESEFNECMKTKAFCIKVLNLLSEGR